MTAAIIGIGLAVIVLGVALFAVWAVLSHDEEYQQDYHACEENMGDW